MGRWEPDAAGRLRRAAMELFAERGYEATTVAQIAGRAGVTERTFFRHFTDKREVLFAGSDRLQELMVAAVAAAPAGSGPMDAVGAGLVAAAGVFDRGPDFPRARQAVIAANEELRERELAKLASLAAALAGALRDRGVDDPAATLAAEAGVAVFRVAFERWAAGAGEADADGGLAGEMGRVLNEMRAVTAPTLPKTRRRLRPAG